MKNVLQLRIMSQKGEINLLGIVVGAFVSISLAAFGFIGNAVSKVDTKAQTALEASTKTASLVNNMNGALKFLVEKNGGEYNPETGIVILKDRKSSNIASSSHMAL